MPAPAATTEKDQPMPYRRFVIPALAFAGLLATAGAPRADPATDAAMEPVWLRYWMAIAAEKKCAGVTFTGPQYDAMTHVINLRVHHAIDAGRRTHLIDEADNEIFDLVFKYGCRSPQVGPYLDLFHAELAPALG
jgi:hypothetical protein